MNAAAWAVLLAVLLAGWAVLDGAVQGAGMGLARLRTDGERRVALAAVGPLLLPGEVWLVAAAGVLVGVFPRAEARLIDAAYPLVVALLVAWVVRDAGLWLRSRRTGRGWRAGWDAAIVGSSTLLPAAAGGILGAAWGTPVAVVVLAAVMTALVRVHGAGVVARRRGASARVPLAVTAAALAAVPVASVAVAWPRLSDGAVGGAAASALGGVALVILPVLVAAQAAAWWLVARRMGPREVVFF